MATAIYDFVYYCYAEVAMGCRMYGMEWGGYIYGGYYLMMSARIYYILVNLSDLSTLILSALYTRNSLNYDVYIAY